MQVSVGRRHEVPVVLGALQSDRLVLGLQDVRKLGDGDGGRHGSHSGRQVGSVEGIRDERQSTRDIKENSANEKK